MQMRMSIRDGEFSYRAYFMILRMVHMGVLVRTQIHIHTDTLSQTHTHYRLILFYLWPGNGSSAMSG